MKTIITIKTCEDHGKNGYALVPNEEHPLNPFEISDPFGIRKAVVPVLLMGPDNIMYGMGTAFHVDGWGTFLSADHVVHTGNPDFFDPSNENRVSTEFTPVLILGVGVVFGTIGLPSQAIAHVINVETPVYPEDNPLKALKGEESFNPIDIAFLKTQNIIPTELNRTLPLRASGQSPKVGDIVVAVGYPKLKCQPINNDDLRYLIEDGMSAAYGKVIDIHEAGRGSKTPIIEIEANWPAGMSGGPVFNIYGEVVGIVSKSILPDEDNNLGNASAVSLASLNKLPEWLPSLDLLNPRWRLGWLICFDNHVCDQSFFFKTIKEAESAGANLDVDYKIVRCSHKLGSNEFMLNEQGLSG